METGRISLVTSPAAIEEFVEVIRRSTFRQLVEESDVEALEGLLRRAELYIPTSIVPVCRDPDDDYLLALAAASDADVLVTRDEVLLVL